MSCMGITCLFMKSSSLLCQKPWVLNHRGSLWYYKTIWFGIFSLSLSKLSRSIHIFPLQNSGQRVCEESSPLLLWPAVGKLFQLQPLRAEVQLSRRLFPYRTTDLSSQVWGRYKFPLVHLYLKKALSVRETTAPRMCAEGRPAAHWWDKLRTNIKASCSALSQLVSTHLIWRLERNADGLPLLRKCLCDDCTRGSV